MISRVNLDDNLPRPLLLLLNFSWAGEEVPADQTVVADDIFI